MKVAFFALFLLGSAMSDPDKCYLPPDGVRFHRMAVEEIPIDMLPSLQEHLSQVKLTLLKIVCGLMDNLSAVPIAVQCKCKDSRNENRVVKLFVTPDFKFRPILD